MRAIVCTAYGPPEVLELRDVEKPTPKDDEVLVKVHATTVHVGDVRIRRFDVPRWQWPLARLALGITKPRNPILGMELAGEVEAAGGGVTRFEEGDRVFGSTFWSGFGAYAEYKCLPAGGMLATIPVNVTFAQAAAGAASGGITALRVLRKAGIQPGQTVLVYGASGSVGTYAVQLARHFGAQVTGVCSTRNLDLVSSLGADQVVDYTQEDFIQRGEMYDVVFDAVDKLEPSRAKQALKEMGTYLNVDKDSGSGGSAKPEDLLFVRDLMAAGKLRSVIDRRYPLEEIVEAHRYVQEGHKRGHVVITIVPDGEP
jgi:NADPH:quinone reductase-like Zn-dependent oxidoreductase